MVFIVRQIDLWSLYYDMYARSLRCRSYYGLFMQTHLLCALETINHIWLFEYHSLSVCLFEFVNILSRDRCWWFLFLNVFFPFDSFAATLNHMGDCYSHWTIMCIIHVSIHSVAGHSWIELAHKIWNSVSFKIMTELNESYARRYAAMNSWHILLFVYALWSG